jgi:uncharacterized membrane protein YhhN
LLLTIILSALALISAILYLQAIYRENQQQVYLFKPFTTILILTIAVVAADPVSSFYKWAIVAGLVFSLGGDIFLILPQNRFLLGLVSFLLAHIVFTLAFASVEGFYTSLWVFVPLLAAGAVIFFGLIWPYLGKYKIPAAIYTIVIFIMAWQAAGYRIQAGNRSSLLVLIGSILFIFSDMVLTMNRFRSPIRNARLIYMPAYYAALWLFAMSITV